MFYKVIAMIELIFSACLATAPQQCKDVHLTFNEPVPSPVMCALLGQVEMAKWMESHPKFRPGRFKCVPVGWREVET